MQPSYQKKKMELVMNAAPTLNEFCEEQLMKQVQKRCDARAREKDTRKWMREARGERSEKHGDVATAGEKRRG